MTLLLSSAALAMATRIVPQLRKAPNPKHYCASLNSTATASMGDPSTIFVGGGGTPHTETSSAMFMSSDFAYLVQVNASGAMDIQQAPMGAFQASAGVIGVYPRKPLILHVIPDGTSDLHFLAINNSMLYDIVPPYSLATVVPQGFQASAAAVRRKLGVVDGLLFASLDTVVSVCLDSLGRVRHAEAFNISAHFDNPLDVDQTVDLKVDHKSDRVYLLRSRSNSYPQDGAEVMVLRISLSCVIGAGHSVFVQPQPISISLVATSGRAGAYVFWPMSPDQVTGRTGVCTGGTSTAP